MRQHQQRQHPHEVIIYIIYLAQVLTSRSSSRLRPRLDPVGHIRFPQERWRLAAQGSRWRQQLPLQWQVAWAPPSCVIKAIRRKRQPQRAHPEVAPKAIAARLPLDKWPHGGTNKR